VGGDAASGEKPLTFPEHKKGIKGEYSASGQSKCRTIKGTHRAYFKANIPRMGRLEPRPNPLNQLTEPKAAMKNQQLTDKPF
jgi:hypothetical protein